MPPPSPRPLGGVSSQQPPRYEPTLSEPVLSHQRSVSFSSHKLRQSGWDESENWSGLAGTKQVSVYVVIVQIVVLLAVVVGAPLFCRYGCPPYISPLPSFSRCGVVILCVLILNVFEVMPLFCTALFIPVLATLCAALGDRRGTVETSSLLIANFFNNISFMILGALVINAIFTKCGIVGRIANCLLKAFRVDSAIFLLLLMLGGMAACSVLYSGSIMMLSAMKPMLYMGDDGRAAHPHAIKRLFLGIAFASNAGSTWLPISSPVNLITVALLREFDVSISLSSWVVVAIPVTTCLIIGCWGILVLAFPVTRADNRESSVMRAQRMFSDERHETLTSSHVFFMFAGCVAILVITVFSKELEPMFGHPACLSLAFVVLAFGSGFMSRDEFLELDWDLLAIVGGTNVLAFMVRETALGATLSDWLVSQDFVASMDFLILLGIMVTIILLMATFLGHTLTGVLLMPLVVVVGVKLQAPETISLLCAITIPLGMGAPQSSFDNQAAYTASRTLGRQKAELEQKDYAKTGFLTSLLAAIIVLTVGFYACVEQYGLPPPTKVAETGTPDRLKPRVTKENLPQELNEVDWNEQVADWKHFQSLPEKKAFAVSDLEPGMKTRSWAAAWNHNTQREANEAAIRDCETVAQKCRLVYPDPSRMKEREKDLVPKEVRVRIGQITTLPPIASTAPPTTEPTTTERIIERIPTSQAPADSRPAHEDKDEPARSSTTEVDASKELASRQTTTSPTPDTPLVRKNKRKLPPEERRRQEADWKKFQALSGKKALAEGEIADPDSEVKIFWSAAWNHQTQDEANEAALQHCQQVARNCRIIWPAENGSDEDLKSNGRAATMLEVVMQEFEAAFRGGPESSRVFKRPRHTRGGVIQSGSKA